MSFSIIIPSRNAANLEACALAIRASGCKADILVAEDDGAITRGNRTEPMCEILCGDLISFLDCASPFVFARNVNNAIKGTIGDVVIMNDDALLLPRPATYEPSVYGHNSYLKNLGSPLEWLEQAAHYGEEFGLVSAAVIGQHKTWDLAPYDYPRLKELEPMADLLFPREVKHLMVPFVCVYIRREVIDEVGLLDERFTDYGGEDNDYCRRVREAGLKIGVYDGCVVDHGTLPSTFRPDGKGRDVSIAKKQYVEKWGDANGW